MRQEEGRSDAVLFGRTAPSRIWNQRDHLARRERHCWIQPDRMSLRVDFANRSSGVRECKRHPAIARFREIRHFPDDGKMRCPGTIPLLD